MFGDERNLHPFTRSQSKEIHTTLEYIVKICKLLYLRQPCKPFCIVLSTSVRKVAATKLGLFQQPPCRNLLKRLMEKNAAKPHIHWYNHGQTMVSSHISLHSMISVNSDRRKVQQR